MTIDDKGLKNCPDCAGTLRASPRPSPQEVKVSNERFDRLVADLREDAEYIDNYSGFVGSPDRIVCTQLAAADTLIRLREALEWYGENARLARLIHSEGDKGRAALSEDGGSRARAAIAASQPAGGEGE